MRVARNLLLSLLFPALGLAQSPTTSVIDRLQHVATLNSLDGADMRPWHLKLSYQLHNERGKLTEAGTLEQWWASRDEWRIAVTPTAAPGKPAAPARIYVQTHGERFHSAASGALPSPIQLLLSSIVHPISPAALNESIPEIRSALLGTAKADCIMLSQPLNGKQAIPLGLYPTYCISPDDALLLSQISVRDAASTQRLGTFLGHKVAMKVHIHDGELPIADAEVTQLQTIEPNAIDLTTDVLTPGYQNGIQIGSGVMAG